VTFYDRFEKVSEADMTKTTRGRLLARAGKVCVGIAAGAAGLSSVGQARADGGGRSVGCCSLAYNNDCTNCSGRGYDCGSGCTRWAWYCVDNARRVWICGECYTGGNCSGCSCGRISFTQGSRSVPRVKGWRT
jgi:hypothetical protein